MKLTAPIFLAVCLSIIGCSVEHKTEKHGSVTADDLAKALNLQFCEIIIPSSVWNAISKNEARLYLLKETSSGSWDLRGLASPQNRNENIRFFGNRITQDVSFVSSGGWGANNLSREGLDYSYFPTGAVELDDFCFGFIDHNLYQSPPSMWIGDKIPKWYSEEGTPPGSKMNWIKWSIVVSNDIPAKVPENLRKNIAIVDSRSGIGKSEPDDTDNPMKPPENSNNRADD